MGDVVQLQGIIEFQSGASASIPDLKRLLFPSSYQAEVIIVHHEVVHGEVVCY